MKTKPCFFICQFNLPMLGIFLKKRFSFLLSVKKRFSFLLSVTKHFLEENEDFLKTKKLNTV